MPLITFDVLRFIYVTNIKVLGGDYAVRSPFHCRWSTPEPEHLPAGRPCQQVRHRRHVLHPVAIGWHHSPRHHAPSPPSTSSCRPAPMTHKDPRTSIGANPVSYGPLYAVTLAAQGQQVTSKFMYNMSRRTATPTSKSGDEFHMDYLVGKVWRLGRQPRRLLPQADDRRQAERRQNPTSGRGRSSPSARASSAPPRPAPPSLARVAARDGGGKPLPGRQAVVQHG